MHIKWQWMDLMFKTKEDIMFYDYEIVLKLCLTRTSTSLLTMIIQIDCEWILANCRAQRDNQKKMSLNEKGCKILIPSKIQLASLMRQEWRNLDQYLNPSSISISVSQSKGGFERWSCGHALLLERSRGDSGFKGGLDIQYRSLVKSRDLSLSLTQLWESIRIFVNEPDRPW